MEKSLQMHKSLMHPFQQEMMKKSMPIAVILCAVMFMAVFIKTYASHDMVIFPPTVIAGLLLGFGLLIVHEWLHAIVYPKEAAVTIGKLKGKMVFVSPQDIVFNGLLFGMACMGMVSPFSDVYNVILVLKQTGKNDKIMFYGMMYIEFLDSKVKSKR